MENEKTPANEKQTAEILTASQWAALETLEGDAKDLSDLEDLGCILQRADGSFFVTGWGSNVLRMRASI